MEGCMVGIYLGGGGIGVEERGSRELMTAEGV